MRHGTQRATRLTAYLAIPSYGDVLVIARAGERAPRLLGAGAGRPGCRRPRSARLQRRLAPQPSRGGGGANADPHVALTRERGYAMVTSKGVRTGSLAAAVPDEGGPPVAALAVQGPSDHLINDESGLSELLHQTAAQLARRACDS